MSDLIDRKQISARIADQSYLWEDDYDIDQALEDIQNAPAVDAIPVSWLTAQAENPSNSDSLRNAIDHIVYTMWAERKEE